MNLDALKKIRVFWKRSFSFELKFENFFILNFFWVYVKYLIRNFGSFKLAKILGFKNYSEYALTTLNAKNPENVQNFLNNLMEKLRVLQKKEMDILLEYKKQEVKQF